MITEESKKCKKVKPKKFDQKLAKKLWVILIIALVSTVLAGFFLPEHKTHFEIEKFPAFYAIFGFISCVVIIFFSKFLGVFLKRGEDYYKK